MDIIITAGQSNFANFYTPLDTTRADSKVSCRGITEANPWVTSFDPQPTADGVSSSVFPRLGNLIVAYTKRDLGFISVGVSNSTIASWAPNGANYSRIRAAIGKCQFSPILCFLWHNGETDSSLATAQIDYENGLKALVNQVRTDAGVQVPCGIAIATHPNEATGSGVKAAQLSIANTYLGCFQGADTDTLDNTYRTDSVHFNSTTGRNAHAQLWFNALMAAHLLRPDAPAPPNLERKKNPSVVFSLGSTWSS